MNKNFVKENVWTVLLGVIVLSIFIYLSGCLGSDDDYSVVTFNSYHEFEEDYNHTEGNYLSASAGDTIKITDTIRLIVHNRVSDFTVIEFISEPGKSETFEGDITDKFKIGDDIMLIFHVIENELNFEVIEETWGRNAPESSIEHVQ